MTNFRTAVTVIIIVLTINAKSENPCGVMIPVNDTTTWGIGFIRANIKETFRGFLSNTKQECFIGNSEIVFGIDNKPEINHSDFVYLGGYSTVLYKVYQIKDTKYNICANSFKGGVWVEFDDLSKNGLDFETYVSFIGKYKNSIGFNANEKVGRHVNMGVNLFSSCLYLRDEPTTEGKIITCLKNNLQEDSNRTTTHLEIQEVIDGWAYIIARIYIYDGKDNDNPDGCAAKVIQEYRGCIKIIGKNGIPNIWYTTSSY